MNKSNIKKNSNDNLRGNSQMKFLNNNNRLRHSNLDQVGFNYNLKTD